MDAAPSVTSSAPLPLRVALGLAVKFPLASIDWDRAADSYASGHLSPGFPVELEIGLQKTLSGRNAAGTDALIIVVRAMP